MIRDWIRRLHKGESLGVSADAGTAANLPIEGALEILQHYPSSGERITVPMVALYNTKQLAKEIAEQLAIEIKNLNDSHSDRGEGN